MHAFPVDYHSIHHDGSARYVRIEGGGEPTLGMTAVVRLRVGKMLPVQRILLRTCPDGEQMFNEMQPEGEPQAGDPCRWWQVQLKLSMPVVPYRFLLFMEDGAWWYNGTGLQRSLATDANDFRILVGYQAPAWVRSAVFYQVFPDRFANGDLSNDVRDDEYTYWGQPARHRNWGEPAASGRAAMVEFYGGDLAGIEQRLETIEELGANALYLNPVFTAYSNHRYDVMDYENVDPHLGGNPALQSLRKALSDRGLRYILDIVPNHCGALHPWFQAAQADPQAPSAEYFTFHQHPQEYECWLGVRNLPKLNFRSAALRKVIYEGKESIFRRWLQPPYAADGWRIDVANMLARQGADQLGVEVGQGVRRAVKETNPQAYLLGENFFDGSSQLQGDMWDATMNYYGFSKPLWFWLSGFKVGQHGEPRSVASNVPWPGQAVAETWQAFLAAIPWVIARQQFNLLGSHDTSRILSLLGGDKALNRLAVAVLFTFPGVPCIYYGDEVGLTGEGGTGARGCMPWDTALWDLDTRRFYQEMIHLRRTSPALVEGGFQVLLAETDTLAYLRDSDEEQIIVAARRGPGSRPAGPLRVDVGGISDGAEFEELFSGARRRIVQGRLVLPELTPGAQVWVSR